MTSFQSQCYEALKKIPAGNVISYGGLAEIIGRRNAHRAVGSAMNKNPFAPTVPCHRVGGFADDISVKIKRLQKEGVRVSNNKIVNFQSVLFKAN